MRKNVSPQNVCVRPTGIMLMKMVALGSCLGNNWRPVSSKSLFLSPHYHHHRHHHPPKVKWAPISRMCVCVCVLTRPRQQQQQQHQNGNSSLQTSDEFPFSFFCFRYLFTCTNMALISSLYFSPLNPNRPRDGLLRKEKRKNFCFHFW